MVDAPETRAPSALVAAVLSAILPGVGHVYAGARRRGLGLLGVDAAMIVVAALVAADSKLRLELTLTVAGLGSLLVVNILTLAYRVWAADDAARIAGSRHGAAAWAFAGGAIAVVVLVAMPHVLAGFYTLVADDLGDVFADEDIAAGATTTTAAPTTQVPDDGSGDPGSSTTTPATLPPAEGPPIWDGLERLNILLLGGDAGAGRREIRTDTMIVISIDPVTGDTAMFSLPRNMVNVPLPDGYGAWQCDCFPRLLNDLYIAGIESPGAFPGPQEPEVNAVKAGIGNLLGLEIHYYALVTLDGFVGVIDALGGVTVDVQFNIVDEAYPHEDGVTRESINIPVGPNDFDGHMALAYTRIRRHADDYARMQRQRCVLEAAIEQASPIDFLRAFPQLASVLKESLRTDIPRSRLVDFVELAAKVDTSEIVTLRFIPPDYISGSNERGNIPDVALIREHTRLATTQDPVTVIETLSLESLDSTCA